jgi:thioredoxin-like negative regulator of GroEL
MLSKTLESMEVPYEINEIDIDETPEKAMKYNVRSIPTLIIVDGTETEIRRANGALNQTALKEFFG